jgi:hypothetical protein
MLLAESRTTDAARYQAGKHPAGSRLPAEPTWIRCKYAVTLVVRPLGRNEHLNSSEIVQYSRN